MKTAKGMTDAINACPKISINERKNLLQNPLYKERQSARFKSIINIFDEVDNDSKI